VRQKDGIGHTHDHIVADNSDATGRFFEYVMTSIRFEACKLPLTPVAEAVEVFTQFTVDCLGKFGGYQTGYDGSTVP
jgi:hypothetical protein